MTTDDTPGPRDFDAPATLVVTIQCASRADAEAHLAYLRSWNVTRSAIFEAEEPDAEPNYLGELERNYLGEYVASRVELESRDPSSRLRREERARIYGRTPEDDLIEEKLREIAAGQLPPSDARRTEILIEDAEMMQGHPDALDAHAARHHTERMADGGDAIFGRTDDGEDGQR